MGRWIIALVVVVGGAGTGHGGCVGGRASVKRDRHAGGQREAPGSTARSRLRHPSASSEKVAVHAHLASSTRARQVEHTPALQEYGTSRPGCGAPHRAWLASLRRNSISRRRPSITSVARRVVGSTVQSADWCAVAAPPASPKRSTWTRSAAGGGLQPGRDGTVEHAGRPQTKAWSIRSAGTTVQQQRQLALVEGPALSGARLARENTGSRCQAADGDPGLPAPPEHRRATSGCP